MRQRAVKAGLNRSGPFECGVAVRTALRSMLLLVVSACATTTAVSPDAAIQQVAAATDSWRAAYDSREPERIVAMYAADAALWGTNLKALATTPAAIAAYFKDAPARPDARVVFVEQHIRVFGDFAINSGTYSFNGFRDGRPVSLPARFSLALRRLDGRWLVVDHHSSWLPK